MFVSVSVRPRQKLSCFIFLFLELRGLLVQQTMALLRLFARDLPLANLLPRVRSSVRSATVLPYLNQSLPEFHSPFSRTLASLLLCRVCLSWVLFPKLYYSGQYAWTSYRLTSRSGLGHGYTAHNKLAFFRPSTSTFTLFPSHLSLIIGRPRLT